MSYDIESARDFIATHGRVLDRRRFELLIGDGDPAAAVSALDAYRNPDGGYGWGLEPDLRSPESQPGAALHAFEVFEEVAPAAVPQALALCDWLDSITLADGGLPFALPLERAAGCAPWWTNADTSGSSLQITAIVAAGALRVATHDPAVAGHRWLERAIAYCSDAIERLDDAPFAYALGFSVRFADALHASRPQQAQALLDHLRRFIPASGEIPVAGGAEGEALRPLDIAPDPNGIARGLFTEEVIEGDIARLASLQQPDGGWIVDFRSASPVAALEWRGIATVNALALLMRETSTAIAQRLAVPAD